MKRRTKLYLFQIPPFNTDSLISYSNYDFVPGDKIIYHYDVTGEKDSEIPSRMLIDEGIAEIQTYKGEKVLFVPADSRV